MVCTAGAQRFNVVDDVARTRASQVAGSRAWGRSHEGCPSSRRTRLLGIGRNNGGQRKAQQEGDAKVLDAQKDSHEGVGVATVASAQRRHYLPVGGER